MFKALTFFTCFVFIACSQPAYKNPHVLIQTQVGDIEVELYADNAPNTVAAFLSFIDSGYYDNTSFYRVLKTEDFSSITNTGIIQGGMWHTDRVKKLTIPGIIHESTKQSGLTHESGTISLARLAPGTANTEFFICIGDQSPLDAGRRGTADGQGYAAFGKVFKGMALVRKIQGKRSVGDQFVERIEIRKISRL